MQIHQTVPLAIAALIGAGGIGFAVREHKQALETGAHEQALAAATISQLEQRVKELSDRLNQQAAEKERPAPVRVRRAPAIKAARLQRPVDDPRWQRVESRLADHEQKIAGTRQDVENTRTELEGKLSSTKDELGG